MDCESCSGNVCLQKLRFCTFSKLSFDDKKRVIAKGRCLPALELTQVKGKVVRNFNPKQYEIYSWLAGCKHTNRLFCFPCLLFSNNPIVWNDSGYSDLHNFLTAAKKHDQSENHLAASIEYHTFGKKCIENETHCVNSQILTDIERHNAKVDQNRSVFERLVGIVCFMARQELTFREQGEENSLSIDTEKYLEIVDLLSRYDGGILKNHLQDSTSSFSGLSDRVHNHLISSVVSVMTETIKQEISTTDFVALMVEEKSDIDGGEQLVLVLRYFHNAKIIDRFVKYVDVNDDHTADTLSSIILQVLSEFNCSSKLIAQTYDGASILFSKLNDMQSLVRQQYPQALYVWCSAHVLNSVLSKSCERIKEPIIFFHVIKMILSFFHNSTERQDHYNKIADIKKLPHFDQSQWTYNSRTVNVIFNSNFHLIDLFEDIEENGNLWDGETLNQVSTLLNIIEEFEFQFFLHIFNEIFTKSDVLYEIIQKNMIDVVYCVEKINEFESFLGSFRTRFEIIYENVKTIIGPPKKKRNIDDPKIYYERIFFEIVDNIANKCRNRYRNLKDLKFFELLSCKHFDKYNKLFPEELVADFVNIYTSYNFSLDHLTNELKRLYNSPEFKNLSIYEIIEHFYENNLNTVFPEVLRLAKLIITVPASSALTEMSFSSLERIHAYLKNTQGLLTDLSMITIEKDLLTETNNTPPSFYNSVLQSYLQKDRCEDLIYK